MNKLCLGLRFGIACASFSRARRGKPGSSMPQALRGDAPDTLWGLPNLPPHDQKKVDLGNSLARYMMCLIRLAVKYRCPLVIENPLTSRLWALPQMQVLLRSATVVTLHACMFGAPWKKPSRLAGWNVDLSALEQKCCGKTVCSRSGRPHEVLSGFRNKGDFKTALASAYEREFCHGSG